MVHPLIPYNTGVWMLLGAVDDEEFGRAVAVVPNAVSPGIAGLLVGSPFGNQSGVVRSGGAAIFRVDADPDSETYGLDPRPLFVFGGETGRSGGRLGEQVAAGMMGDAPVVIMGGYEASGVGLDQGAAYTALLPAAD